MAEQRWANIVTYKHTAGAVGSLPEAVTEWKVAVYRVICRSDRGIGLIVLLYIINYSLNCLVLQSTLFDFAIVCLSAMTFFLCRREAVKGNKNKTKRLTVVPVPGKSSSVVKRMG